MKRLFLVMIMAVVSVVFSDVCHAQFDQISIDDYSIQSISPESFSSVRGAVLMQVTNAGESFMVSDIKGTVYKNGTPFVTGKADSFYVAHGAQKVQIRGRASLCPGTSLWTVLGLLMFDPEDYTVDISVTIITDSGNVRVISKTRLPVTALLKIK